MPPRDHLCVICGPGLENARGLTLGDRPVNSDLRGLELGSGGHCTENGAEQTEDKEEVHDGSGDLVRCPAMLSL